jgi:hypothetical protein
MTRDARSICARRCSPIAARRYEDRSPFSNVVGMGNYHRAPLRRHASTPAPPWSTPAPTVLCGRHSVAVMKYIVAHCNPQQLTGKGCVFERCELVPWGRRRRRRSLPTCEWGLLDASTWRRSGLRHGFSKRSYAVSLSEMVRVPNARGPRGGVMPQRRTTAERASPCRRLIAGSFTAAHASGPFGREDATQRSDMFAPPNHQRGQVLSSNETHML